MNYKRMTILTLVLSLMLAAIQTAAPSSAAQRITRSGFRQKEIVIRLNPGVDISSITSRIGAAALEKINGDEIYRIGWSDAKDVQQVLAGLKEDKSIAVAGPNYVFQMPEVLQSSSAFVDQSSSAFVDGQSPVSFFSQPQVLNLGIKQAQAYTLGGGVRVAVIDTGIDASHPLFAGRILPGYDFVSLDSVPNDEPGGIAYGHGTFVAGLVTLSAPNAMILPLRAFGPDGQGTSFNIAKAIRYAYANGARVINMSFGLLAQDPLIQNVIMTAPASTYMVASAGNSNLNALNSPADMVSHTTAVASTTAADLKESFSNFHANVRVSAPGTLYSAYPANRWATWSGTSFSAGLVSGEAALLLAINPSASRAQLNTVIQNSGVNLNTLNPGYAGMLGRRINFLAAVQSMLGL